MVSARLLSEATSWNCHNSGIIDHFHTVYEVRLLSLLKCTFDEFLGEVDPREAIHGSFNLGACDLLHVVEGPFEELCSLF